MTNGPAKKTPNNSSRGNEAKTCSSSRKLCQLQSRAFGLLHVLDKLELDESVQATNAVNERETWEAKHAPFRSLHRTKVFLDVKHHRLAPQKIFN
jgi:hypothetical protein